MNEDCILVRIRHDPARPVYPLHITYILKEEFRNCSVLCERRMKMGKQLFLPEAEFGQNLADKMIIYRIQERVYV